MIMIRILADATRVPSEAGGKVTRRGLARLAVGLTALWLVFWTCAYVIGAPVSENMPSQSPALTLTTGIILVAVAVLGLPWIISGFRQN